MVLSRCSRVILLWFIQFNFIFWRDSYLLSDFDLADRGITGKTSVVRLSKPGNLCCLLKVFLLFPHSFLFCSWWFYAGSSIGYGLIYYSYNPTFSMAKLISSRRLNLWQSSFCNHTSFSAFSFPSIFSPFFWSDGFHYEITRIICIAGSPGEDERFSWCSCSLYCEFPFPIFPISCVPTFVVLRPIAELY